jgi:hypothetical protein
VCCGRIGSVALGRAGGELSCRGDIAGRAGNFGDAGVMADSAAGDALGFTIGGIGRLVATGELTLAGVAVAVAVGVAVAVAVGVAVGACTLGCGVAEERGETPGCDPAPRVGEGEAECAGDGVGLAIGLGDGRGVAVLCGLAVGAATVAVTAACGVAAAVAVVVPLGAALAAAPVGSVFAIAFAGAFAGGVASAMTFARAWSAAALFGIPDQPFSTTALLICLLTSDGRRTFGTVTVVGTGNAITSPRTAACGWAWTVVSRSNRYRSIGCALTARS